MRHFDARHLGEEGAGQMLRAAVSGRCVIDLARFRLRERDQFPDGFRRQRGMDHDDIRSAGDLRHRGIILQRIVRKFLVERRAHEVRVADGQQGITIGRRFRHLVRADGRTRARTIVDDHLLSERFRHFLRQDAAGHIGGAPRREWHHKANRAVWIGLRANGAGHDQGSRGRGHELPSTRKFRHCFLRVGLPHGRSSQRRLNGAPL